MQIAVLPLPSVAVNCKVVVPLGKIIPLLNPVASVCVTVAKQLSVAGGVEKVTTSPWQAFMFAGQVIVGEIVSKTVTKEVQVLEFPKHL